MSSTVSAYTSGCLLRDKGRSGDSVPHQLVLTATPIPRTLAMTAYADLDVSAIDELPPGRTPVTTVAIANGRRNEVIERIRAACADGRQAYWVCTIIEESEQLQAQAAEAIHGELSRALPDHRVDLVHGRLKPLEKQRAMEDFASGKTSLLVATTVIEVGVDVPNASLMIIENAERLGLAQLHQLRGRVGRGSAASSCVLLYQTPLSMMARQRLDVLRETGDGFRIAEKDLELRGPGEVLGTRQTGQLSLRIADHQPRRAFASGRAACGRSDAARSFRLSSIVSSRAGSAALRVTPAHDGATARRAGADAAARIRHAARTLSVLRTDAHRETARRRNRRALPALWRERDSFVGRLRDRIGDCRTCARAMSTNFPHADRWSISCAVPRER